jgi:hypothetical protein
MYYLIDISSDEEGASQSKSPEVPAARRTVSNHSNITNNVLQPLFQQSTSSSISLENIYPPSRFFSRDCSNHSTNSLDEPEFLEPGVTNSATETPAQENFYQYMYNKIKAWLDRLLTYFLINLM